MLVEESTAALFRGLSSLRGRRIFHPNGVGFAASFTPLAGARTGAKLLDSGRPRRAIVRLSRSIGLPERLWDPCGLAFRILDAYGPGRPQDLLLVSSAAPVAARHLILPSRGFADRAYSSLLPYRVGGRLHVFGAVALAGQPGPRLCDLRARERAELSFRLLLAAPSGAWQEVADLELEQRLPDEEIEDLGLDPTNSGGGIEPAGLLNRLRNPAYRGSQQGRGAISEAGAAVDAEGTAAEEALAPSARP